MVLVVYHRHPFRQPIALCFACALGASVVNQPANLLRELEVGAQVRPVIPPGLSDFGIFLVPTVCEPIQSIQGGSFINSSINFFQISHKGLEILTAYIFAGISELVNDAVLNLRSGIYGLNRCRESRQVICTGDEDILYTAGFQSVKDGAPGFGTFIFTNLHTENIFFAVQIDSYGDVDGLLHDLTFAPDMVVNRIQKYHRINAFQRSLPFFHDGKNLVCNSAYCCV